jgi:pilus assembly protein Flp/PilA
MEEMKIKIMLEKIKEFYCQPMTFAKSEKGQTLVEYALILVLIALVVIVMLGGIGQSVNSVYSTINSAL